MQRIVANAAHHRGKRSRQTANSARYPVPTGSQIGTPSQFADHNARQGMMERAWGSA
jgi:hypothetical protein